MLQLDLKGRSEIYRGSPNRPSPSAFEIRIADPDGYLDIHQVFGEFR